MTSTESTRTEYVKKVENSLREMNSKITRLEASLGEAKVEGKEKIRGLVNEVEAKRDEVQNKLKKLGASGEAAGGELTKGLDRAWGELTDSYQRASEHLKQAVSAG